MSKNIVLLALLLPFSGSAITKEEKQQIVHKVARTHIWNALTDWMYVLSKYNCIDLSLIPEGDREWFCKQMAEFRKVMEELEKEYKESEQPCKE